MLQEAGPPPPAESRRPHPAFAPSLPRSRPQLPTLRNAVLKHGSWAAFFAEHGLDVACLQARGTAVNGVSASWLSRWLAPPPGVVRQRSGRGLAMAPTPSPACTAPNALQETKLIEEKLTKELCCVEGFQSFWAVSRSARPPAWLRGVDRSTVLKPRLRCTLTCAHAQHGLPLPGTLTLPLPPPCPACREKKGYSGVATYAADAFAPLSAEADCLGGGGGEDGDLDREGRRAGRPGSSGAKRPAAAGCGSLAGRPSATHDARACHPSLT